jgi:meso-butanediol dehydrogenase/(S,S)-butanediol dehydrogenase/diacetyl reductase
VNVQMLIVRRLYARHGVRVNCVLPGMVQTPMLARLPNVEERSSKLTPMGRVATPIEVARCALFLASDDAAFVTGEALIVDDGYTLR